MMDIKSNYLILDTQYSILKSYFLCHQAHNISIGCKSNLNHAMAGVTVKLPNLMGASISIVICTGKKAISISIMLYEATLRVFGRININAKRISKKPASILSTIGKGK